MFSNHLEAITYIEDKRIKRTFQQFQDTINKYKIVTTLPYTIHIAGTNGKGSTVQYVKNILLEHGYRVGTFTSPYMIEHNDRICINGEAIGNEQMLHYINTLYPIIEAENLSMFEIDVLIMLLYFSEQPLDFCIIETGIGGKNDKTNVIPSKISAITNIGFDHQEMLGKTLVEIAQQKAGIIKQNQRFITGEINPQLLDIFSNICKYQGTKMETIKKEEGNQFTYNNNTYTLPQGGSYQIYNAKLAVAIASHCIDLKQDKTQQAITKFSYPGRFEQIGNIYLDGAHNVDGIKALVMTMKQLALPNACIIFSSLGDKDSKAMLDLLKGYPVYLASFEDDRLEIKAPNYQKILNQVRNKYETIIITGSLHFVSVVRKYVLLREKERI